jgi:DNA-binding NarL/FixJ family response regulator
MQEASAANPDVVIFDSAKVALFGSCAIARMREAGLSAKIVMIGMEDDETIFLRAVEEGVMGYALQDATSAENTRVVRAVANGEAICPPRYSARLFECAARDISFSFNPSHRTQYGLTQREQQVVGLIRLGLSNKGIGARLSLSERTVKNHIHRILRKVGANDRLDIVARCKSEVPALTNHEFGERRYRDDRGINPQ